MPANPIFSVRYINIGPGKVLLKFSRIPIPKLFNLDDLSTQPGVLEVSFSSKKKTLLLSFDPDKFILTQFLSSLKKKDTSIIIRKKKRKVDREIIHEEGDFLSQFIMRSFSEGNKIVKNELSNFADITSLLPVTFLALGLLQLVRQPAMPKWNELLWYGYSLFREYNRETGIDSNTFLNTQTNNKNF